MACFARHLGALHRGQPVERAPCREDLRAGRDIGVERGREGARGLALAREQSPDLILLDLHLPDMPGEQVRPALLADPLTEEIPVVIVIGRCVAGPAKRLRAAGRRRII